MMQQLVAKVAACYNEKCSRRSRHDQASKIAICYLCDKEGKMTHGQTDLRIRRTHKLLQEAMIALIAERGFDAITVGDIADRAMVNRATFYRHYEDKYDLVAKIFEETANELIDNMKSQPKKFSAQDPENRSEERRVGKECRSG